jgi:hypothetical protein
MTKASLIDRIEKALDRVALAIINGGENGAVYLPIYERLEREAASLRSKQGAMAAIRARASRLAVQPAHQG